MTNETRTAARSALIGQLMALPLGILLGFGFGESRHADEVAALDRALGAEQAARWTCTRALEGEIGAVGASAAGDCSTAAAACATVASEVVELRRADGGCRAFLRLAPGPRVSR